MSGQKELTQVKQWTVAPEITLPKKQELVEMDDDTRAFDEECRAIVAEARASQTERSVRLAQIALQDEFFWRFEAASSMQQHVSGSRNRLRITLFDLYRKYYLELRALQRKVTPLLNEAASPPVPEPQFQGIFLGKDLGRAFE